jgi:hypothetical protein
MKTGASGIVEHDRGLSPGREVPGAGGGEGGLDGAGKGVECAGKIILGRPRRVSVRHGKPEVYPVFMKNMLFDR